MSDTHPEDQRLLRRAEVQQAVEAAGDKLVAAMNATLDDLRRLMEVRFSKAHEDLKTHTLSIHGIELAMTRVQGTVSGIERDIHQTRAELERELASLREGQGHQDTRIASIEHVQASREAIYQMMHRLVGYILTAFLAALAGLVYVQGTS